MQTIAPSGRPKTTMRFTSFVPELQQAEAFRREVAQWFYAALQCRMDVALDDEKGPHRDLQRGALTSLISWGEWAQNQVHKEGIDLSPIDVSVRDISAETRILRDTYRSAFDNCLTREEAGDVLKEVFG
jgi:hypothetical protein